MDLSDRMKEYELQSRTRLLRRTPVIIRLDGKAFHTFTRGFDKPFDEDLVAIMQNTMLKLCQSIQGCVLGYTQSDEITLVLIDYKNRDTSAWVDNQVQKMTSLAASLATNYFNAGLHAIYMGIAHDMQMAWHTLDKEQQEKILTRYRLLEIKTFQAAFDARAFNVPQWEVCNNLIWRQQDGVRNSIQALAHSLYSDQEIFGINMNDMQNKMLTEKDVNWNELDVCLKRGACARKNENGEWYIDLEIPTFTENREYIDKLIFLEGE